MNKFKLFSILFFAMLASIAFFAFMPQNALALSNGAGGYSVIETGGSSCGGCHGGGVAPTVGMSGPNGLQANETGSYVFTVQSNNIPNQDHAGFNVVVYDAANNKVGTFTATEAGTQEQFGDITHMGARANDASGLSTFTFDWTAPATTGAYTMHYAGNSVDLNGNPGGDQFMAGTMDVTVSIPSAVTLSGSSVTTISVWALPLLAVVMLSALTIWVKEPRTP